MREIKFGEVLYDLSIDLLLVRDYGGDLSDVGNEVGYILGNILNNMTDEDVKNFITGFKHGVSLTNGTHG